MLFSFVCPKNVLKWLFLLRNLLIGLDRLIQSLITVESDKASMEIPSSTAGVVKELRVTIGDKVKQGVVVLLLQTATNEASPLTPPLIQGVVAPVQSAIHSGVVETSKALVHSSYAAEMISPVTNSAHTTAASRLSGLPHASPSMRKFARELGVPLEEIKGHGLKGRITREDVQAFTKAVMSGAVQTKAQAAKAPAGGLGGDVAALGLIPWPKVDFAKFGPIERKEMGRIKKISGANLLRNAVMIPAVTNFDEADITDLEAFRISTNLENEKSAKAGNNASVKVTMLAFLIKA